MCQDFADLKARAEARGVELGFEQGVEQGVLRTLVKLVDDGVLTVAEAAERAKMTVAEFCSKTGLTERRGDGLS